MADKRYNHAMPKPLAPIHAKYHHDDTKQCEAANHDHDSQSPKNKASFTRYSFGKPDNTRSSNATNILPTEYASMNFTISKNMFAFIDSHRNFILNQSA